MFLYYDVSVIKGQWNLRGTMCNSFVGWWKTKKKKNNKGDQMLSGVGFFFFHTRHEKKLSTFAILKKGNILRLKSSEDPELGGLHCRQLWESLLSLQG